MHIDDMTDARLAELATAGKWNIVSSQPADVGGYDCEWLLEEANPGDLRPSRARVYYRPFNKRGPRYAVYLSGSKKMLSVHAVVYGQITATIAAHYANKK